MIELLNTQVPFWLAMLIITVIWLILNRQNRLSKGVDTLVEPVISNISAKTCHSGHLNPVYHGYKGGYHAVNKCTECQIIGLYEDMHTIEPCSNCGGKVVRNGTAKWGNVQGVYQWIGKK